MIYSTRDVLIDVGSCVPRQDAWNNLIRTYWEHILIAIGVIGVVGLLLEQGMTWVANRFDYRSK